MDDDIVDMRDMVADTHNNTSNHIHDSLHAEKRREAGQNKALTVSSS
jgi:hypothetical protein